MKDLAVEVAAVALKPAVDGQAPDAEELAERPREADGAGPRPSPRVGSK